jgi:hypothetical protein
MGPFPHSAPKAAITPANPAGTDGFEFVEFAHPEPQALRDLFIRMGYALTARHRLEWGDKRQAWDGELSTHPGPGQYRNLLGGAVEFLETGDESLLSQRLRLGRTNDTARIERLLLREGVDGGGWAGHLMGLAEMDLVLGAGGVVETPAGIGDHAGGVLCAISHKGLHSGDARLQLRVQRDVAVQALEGVVGGLHGDDAGPGMARGQRQADGTDVGTDIDRAEVVLAWQQRAINDPLLEAAKEEERKVNTLSQVGVKADTIAGDDAMLAKPCEPQAAVDEFG